MAAIDQHCLSAGRALERGDWAGAQEEALAALRQQPGHVEAQRMLALALHHLGRSNEAAERLRRLARRAPANALVVMNLGSVQLALGESDGAIESFRRACQLAPERGAAWYNLGRSLKLQAMEAESLGALERAASLRPGHAATHAVLGDVRKALGDVHGAELALRRAIALQPRSGHAWWSLANLKVVPLDAGDVERMRRAIAGLPEGSEDRILIQFSLGRALECVGDHEAAFAAIAAANHAQRARVEWDADAFSRQVDGCLASFIGEPPAAGGGPGSEVIFIVGLPRSGTTLVEHLLVTHADVDGASELPDLPAVLVEEGRRRGRPFPDWCADASATDWQRLGREYLRRTQRWQAGGRRFTDKLPANLLHVGAVLRMLPGAHVVGCRRDPLDTMWSCYQQYFHAGNAFSYDLVELREYQRACERLHAHWRRVDPVRFHEVDYAGLVDHSDSTVSGLLVGLGLDCPAPGTSASAPERAIRSASAAQVREAVDRRGIGRWRPYARWLQPWLGEKEDS